MMLAIRKQIWSMAAFGAICLSAAMPLVVMGNVIVYAINHNASISNPFTSRKQKCQ